jgi:hypothetical protein
VTLLGRELLDRTARESRQILHGGRQGGENGSPRLVGERDGDLRAATSLLLERAGFTLADIPKQWEPFWSFWCDQVQPAVRQSEEPLEGITTSPNGFLSDKDSGGMFYVIRLA